MLLPFGTGLLDRHPVEQARCSAALRSHLHRPVPASSARSNVIGPLLNAVPLALGAAISPAFVGVTAELLATGGRRRRTEVLAYLLGGTAPLLGIGVLALFVFPRVLGPSTRLERLTVDLVDVGLGAALLLLATWLVTRRLRQPRGAARKPGPPTTDDRSVSGGTVRWVGLGVVMMATNVSTIVMSLGALREIVRAGMGPLGAWAALLVLVGVAMAPVWLPLCVDVVAPEASARVLKPVSRLIDRHGTALAASASAFFGVYLLVRGFTVL